MQELSSCLTAGCTLFTKTCLNKSVRTIRRWALRAAGWALRRWGLRRWTLCADSLRAPQIWRPF